MQVVPIPWAPANRSGSFLRIFKQKRLTSQLLEGDSAVGTLDLFQSAQAIGDLVGRGGPLRDRRLAGRIARLDDDVNRFVLAETTDEFEIFVKIPRLGRKESVLIGRDRQPGDGEPGARHDGHEHNAKRNPGMRDHRENALENPAVDESHVRRAWRVWPIRKRCPRPRRDSLNVGQHILHAGQEPVHVLPG